ncbi:hypothetical protein AWB67_02074 [Caballeronia terrestris]|uniref:Uncharacterized protein n=1 Tax=Caballeronia terrestris TaxID=1226301 RepID=A0A158HU32_9BURK|nr:hypothetical protein [Caballeronia terrestris]SAL47190.1 hypothetical protein AWB67_02074 [Caballeronia terrestris]
MRIKARTFGNPESNSTLVFANTGLAVASASAVDSAVEARTPVERETPARIDVVTAAPSVTTITLWDEITSPTPAPAPTPLPQPVPVPVDAGREAGTVSA